MGLAHVVPEDEYDCVIDPLLGMLERNATEREIASFLEDQVRDHFGFEPIPRREADFATDVKAWFDKCWYGFRA